MEKIEEIGNYNPQTKRYESSFRDAITQEPVTEPLDPRKVPVVGNYNAAEGKYDDETEDRAQDDAVDLTEDK